MIAVIGFGVLAIVFGACVLLRADRTPRELRGDWWTRFERDFRSYAERAPNASRPPRQRKPQQ